MVKRFTKHIFLTVFMMLTLVFVTGLLLGRHLERSEESEISVFLKENELITESYLLEQSLIRISGEQGCELAKIRIQDLSNQLGEIGSRLSMEDAGEVLGETNYNLLKRRYHLMQIRTYFMFEQLSDTCNMDKEIMLYYYGPDGGLSTSQGEILDTVVREKGIIVFAIEKDFSEELAFVEYYYNITSTPSIVVDFNRTIEGLVEYDELIEFLG